MTQIGETRNAHTNLVEISGKKSVGDKDVDGKIIFK